MSISALTEWQFFLDNLNAPFYMPMENVLVDGFFDGEKIASVHVLPFALGPASNVSADVFQSLDATPAQQQATRDAMKAYSDQVWFFSLHSTQTVNFPP